MGIELEYFKNEKFDFYVGEEQNEGGAEVGSILSGQQDRRCWHGIIPYILDKRGSWERPQKKASFHL